MSDVQPDAADPRRVMRGAADRLLASAATIVDQVVASERFSHTFARGIQTAVNVSASARRRVNAVGDFAAAWLNIPTRRQLIELARRLNQLELAVDDVDAKAAQVLRRLGGEDDG